jgi:hypothetical protein
MTDHIYENGVAKLFCVYSIYATRDMPWHVAKMIAAYEDFYEIRQIPVSARRFVALLRNETGWPNIHVPRFPGGKRWIVFDVPSEAEPESKASDN